jgi:alpha-galactosidase
VPDRANAVIVLHSEGVSVLLDITQGRLPAVVHWGADLGDVSPQDAEALVLSGIHPIAPNVVDEPVRVAVLPEHWTGWVGRPGISGSHGGRDWSPKFTATEIRLDGSAVAAGIDGPTLINTAGGSVAVDAVDDVAQLRLTITLELSDGGLLRGRVELTNQSIDPYELIDCLLAFPLPQSAREILDMAGRWGKERVPQRRSLGVGMHLREGRKGRTGADAATVLHVGTPGFPSTMARSGPCTRAGAAITPTTPSDCRPVNRSSAAESSCCPAK